MKQETENGSSMSYNGKVSGTTMSPAVGQ